MPVMDGFDATRAIRASQPLERGRIAIVAMRANALAKARDACLAAGIDDYISKPATLADLQAILERWLPSKKLDTVKTPR